MPDSLASEPPAAAYCGMAGACNTLPYRATSDVPKVRCGGYVFIARRSDHPPRHVHVYRNGRLVVKGDLENKKPMKRAASARILQLLDQLEAEGQL
jgi:hypothetical protein